MKKILCSALFLLAFRGDHNPVMIQDWQLDYTRKNDKGDIVDVHYKKVGTPHKMNDSDLKKTVHTIIN